MGKEKYIAIIVFLLLLSLLVITNSDEEKSSALHFKEYLNNSQEKYIDNKKVSMFNDMLVISNKNVVPDWMPNGTNRITFEIQIEDLKKGINVSLLGTTFTPRYYEGNFIFNTSIPGLIQFYRLNPEIKWKYATKYNIIYSNLTLNETCDEIGDCFVSDYEVVEEKQYYNYQDLPQIALSSFRSNFFKSEAYQDPDISTCGVLGVPDTEYNLTSHVTSTGNCMTINATNITLNCNGFNINYSSAGTVGYGVNVSRANFTMVKNCVIRDKSITGSTKNGINADAKSFNGTFFNNTFWNLDIDHTAIYIAGDSFNVSSNYMFSNMQSAIWLDSSDFAIVENNTINGSSYGIRIASATKGTFYNNIIKNTTAVFPIFFTISNLQHANHSIDTSNYFLDRPINYTLNISNKALVDINFQNFGAVYFMYSDNLTINRCNFSEHLQIHTSRNVRLNNSRNILVPKSYAMAIINSYDFTMENSLSNVTASATPAFYMTGSANATVYNNIIQGTTESLMFNGITNSSVFNNTIGIGSRTIRDTGGDRNYFANNTVTGNAGTGFWINSPNSVYESSTIYVSGSTASSGGILLFSESTGNNFTGITIHSSASSSSHGGIQITTTTGTKLNDTRFVDCVINVSNANVNETYISTGLSQATLIFVNVTNETGMPLERYYVGNSNATIFQKWWLNVYTNYSNGSLVNNVNISVFDSSNNFVTSIKTNTNGRIQPIELLEKIYNFSYPPTALVTTYLGEYTINATIDGTENLSLPIDLTQTLNTDLNFNFTAPSGGDTEVNTCRNLTEANTEYIQTMSINASSSTCINITAENVTFDGNGFWINSTFDITGVYSSKFNSTIKNCKVDVGSNLGGYGILLENSSGNLVENNTLKGQYAGIYLNSNVRGSIIRNNRLIQNDNRGLHISSSSGNLIENNNISSNYFYGLLSTISSNNTILNNTFSDNVDFGIFIGASLDGTPDGENQIISNIVKLSDSNVYIESSNNIIRGNLINNSQFYHGLYIFNGSNNLAENNRIYNSYEFGIRSRYAENTTLRNNTIIGSVSCSIEISKINSGCILENNTIINNGTMGDGICLIEASNNNISGGEINATRCFNLEYSNNNSITNTNLINCSQINITLSSINNVFLNTSYSSGIEDVSSASSLTRKWYYKAYVNDSNGNNVSGANVTAYNVSGIYQFNLTTDATGYSSTEEIIDYVNNGTRTYYSLYNIYASNSSYLTLNHTYNATLQQSNYKDVFTLMMGDTESPQFSNNVTNPTNNTEYVKDGLYTFNITITSTNGTVLIEFNGTNYTMTNETSAVYNFSISDRATGDYEYAFCSWGNGTSHLFNCSERKGYTIAKNQSTNTSLIISPSAPIIYPTPVNLTCRIDIGEGTPVLTATSLVGTRTPTSSIPQVYDVETWSVLCNATTSQNYTWNETSGAFIVTQNTTYEINLTFAPSNPVTYPTETTVTGVKCPTELYCELSRDGVNITNPDVKILGVSPGYAYVFNTSGNSNYSLKSAAYTLVVTQATGIINGTINGTQGNFTAINGSANQNIYINATNKTGVGTGKIYVNGTLYNSGTLPIFNVTNLSIGLYNITFEYDGNVNYSGSFETWWVNVTAVTVVLPFDINFSLPTPANASTQSANAIPVNLSVISSTDYYSFVDFDKSLLVYTRLGDDFNANSNATDLAYGNNLTCTNCPIIRSVGKWGNSSYFSTNKAYNISRNAIQNLDFATSNFTYNIWFNSTATATGEIVCKQAGTATSTTAGFRAVRSSVVATGISVVVANGSSNYRLDSGTTTCRNNSIWCMLTVVVNRNGNNMSLYLNGVMVNSLAIGTGSYANTYNIRLGDDVDGTINRFFTGEMDDFMMFNRTLTQAEISSLYNASLNKYYNNFTNLADGYHKFTGYAVNNLGMNQTDERWVNIWVDNFPNVTLINPNDGNITNLTSVNFNCSATDDYNLVNISLFGNWSGSWAINQTNILSGTSNSTNFTVDNLANGTYSWNCEACDNASQCILATANRTLTINTSYGVSPVTCVENTTYFLTPYVMAWNETTEIIRFESVLPVNATIDYGTTQSYGSTVSNISFGTKNEIMIQGLSANTLYYYKVSITNITSATCYQNTTFNSTFKTSQNARTSFVFGIMSDTATPDAVCSVDTAHFPSIVGNISAKGADFILMPGDIVRANNGGCNYADTWQTFHNKSVDVRKLISFIASPGNHDDTGTAEGNTAWKNYWVLPLNGNGTTGEWDEKTYSWRYDNSLFISLNTLDTSAGGIGNITGNQLTWFNQTLQQAGYVHKFVFTHYPLVGSSRPSTLPVDDPASSQNLDTLMNSNGVTAAFYGHNNLFCFNTTNNGMLHITSGDAGEDMHTGYCVGTEISDQYTYILVNVTGYVINGTVYNETGAIVFSFSRDMASHPQIQFIPPTLANSTITPNTSIIINISIIDSNLTNLTYNWNGTNFTFYDNTLRAGFNFDNVSALGETYTPNTIVYDISPWHNNGNITNSSAPTRSFPPKWIANGKYGGAFNFTAVIPRDSATNDNGSSILIPHSDSLNPYDSDFSMMYWFNCVSGTTDADISRKGSTGTSPGNIMYKTEIGGYGTANLLSLNFISRAGTSGGATNRVLEWSTSVCDSNWHFAVGQRNGNMAELWVDGSRKMNGTFTGDISNSANLTIGSKDTQDDDHYNGLLDEYRLYINRSFNSSEIQQLYMGNLQMYNLTQWYLYINQTQNVTDILGNGTYTYQAFATNNVDASNQTDLRTIIINTSYGIDTEYPKFSSLTENPSDPAAYSSTQNYWFNVTILSTNGTAGIEFNGTNYSLSNITNNFYKQFNPLSAGIYNYTYWAYGNGTSHLFNSTAIQGYIINKATLSIDITWTSPITYPTPSDSQGVETNTGDDDVVYSLYREDPIGSGIFIAVANPDNTILTPGLWDYKFNATEGQNYSQISLTKGSLTVLINASAATYTYLDNLRSNITILNNTAIWLNATLFNISGIVYLYNNGTLINQGSSPLSNFTAFNNTGMYNITGIYVGNENYSGSFETWWVNVSEITDSIYPTFSNYWDNNGSFFNSGEGEFNVTLLSTNGTVFLEINNTNITAINLSTSVYNASYNFTNVGVYAYRWHSWGNGTLHNYNKSIERSYTIKKVIPEVPTGGGSGFPGGTYYKYNASIYCPIVKNFILKHTYLDSNLSYNLTDLGKLAEELTYAFHFLIKENTAEELIKKYNTECWNQTGRIEEVVQNMTKKKPFSIEDIKNVIEDNKFRDIFLFIIFASFLVFLIVWATRRPNSEKKTLILAGAIRKSREKK